MNLSRLEHRSCICLSRLLASALLAATLVATAGPAVAADDGWQMITVKASSYTLDPKETRPSSGGHVGAFGDKLSPGDKIIAVSRDLIAAGLTAGTRVRIEGLKGTYTVLDKMHKRWQDKIDILFPKKKTALDWGVQEVRIQYRPPAE